MQWYFPLSRGWAAALAAGGDVERFCAAVPVGRLSRRLLPRVLATAEERQATLADADARWEEAFFGRGRATALAERQRLDAAASMMALRTALLPLHLEVPLPAVAWQVEEMDSVARRHAARLADPALAFAGVVDPARVEASRGFPGPLGVEGWVRFPAATEVVRDRAWARIGAPLRPADDMNGRIPSVVFAHGIGMEAEFTAGRDPLAALVEAGLRSIRPEGPWHGRRRLPGFYGGEPVLARGPGGLLDYFHALVMEIGTLVAWARATRGGPVVVSGVSLGALTAQLAGVVARHWPEDMRPDALFLVAPSRSLAAVALEGSLTCGLGVPEAMRRSGWTVRDIGRWAPLLEPTVPPVVPPERIVVVIGETDDVTLAEGGEALVRAWGLPEQNVFRARAGHFSTTLGLARDRAPFRRLLDIVRDAA